MKIPIHIRLNYLITLLQRRIISGRWVKTSWKRQDKLVQELRDDYKGFLVNGKVVRIYEKRYQ
jgi:hypothetical protein